MGDGSSQVSSLGRIRRDVTATRHRCPSGPEGAGGLWASLSPLSQDQEVGVCGPARPTSAGAVAGCQFPHPLLPEEDLEPSLESSVEEDR